MVAYVRKLMVNGNVCTVHWVRNHGREKREIEEEMKCLAEHNPGLLATGIHF